PLFFRMYRRDWTAPLHDTEWRLYMSIIAVASAVIAVNLVLQGDHFSVLHALRESAFTVVSMMTGTGFVTEDFDVWPPLSRAIIFTLMLSGGCAGSTTGGIKILRLLLLAKIAYWRIENTFRPKTVRAVRVG